MKKITSILLLITLTLVLTACKNEDPNNDNSDCDPGFIMSGDTCVLDGEDYIDIYYINDFHGALLADDDQLGISYIANLINTRKEEDPAKVVFLAGGDILQGSALSNYFLGLSTIELLNLMELDAFTIGNHEFDWGIESIMNYADGDESNGEADFPFLGANIFYEGTDTIVTGMEPYTIIEVGIHKIGVIGTMGYGLESSIATSRIDGYDFGAPVDEIEYYATLLRTQMDCDTVIVVAHDSGAINTAVANLEGDAKIDAVFNGHSHNEYTYITGGIPVMQSGANGEYVGHIRISYSDGIISDYTMENYDGYENELLWYEDERVAALLETYILETSELFDEEIFVSQAGYSSYQLSDWISKLMRISTNADIAFQNYGGTRTDIANGETISLAKLYTIWPFDNVVKTAVLNGSQIQTLINGGSLAYDTDITSFNPTTYYLVATNDYVFDKTENPFIYSDTIVNTGLNMRDLAYSEMILQALLYSTFSTTNDIQTTPITYTE